MRNFRQGSNRDGFSMENRSGGNRFNRKSRGFKGRRSGGREGFRDRNSGSFERRSPEMHDVTCDKCGKRCQVPFRPSGDKPVFCSECFRQNEGSDSNFSSRNQDKSPQSGISSEQLNKINAKLDKIIQILQDLEMVEENDSDDKEDSEED